MANYSHLTGRVEHLKNYIQNTEDKKGAENRVTTKIRTHLSNLLTPNYTPDYIREEVAHIQEMMEKERARSDRERVSDLQNFLFIIFVVIPLVFALLAWIASC